ncbi:IS110 family transposase [Pseudomonas sp. SMT-1]|uniref:IS110 family transposase n=1 Tax=Pseudomonas sp. SMT-1 TaxID=435519 RepID=UPI000D944E47|nr:IS110 family transposase [Pseudomonas sp. SMT-1]PXZ45449.1 IS110 family transposase [Pseudomonas sp. SMT-1]
MARKPSKQRFTVVHPDCAAIDVGGREHFVAVDPRHENPVQSFTSFTDDLLKMANWLESLGIKVVAMESTGVYWIPIYEILSERGFDVYLVNARATRQITGRKSDVLDCQWIWQLMTHGLLRGAFRPDDLTCCVRSLVRQRASKVKDQAQTLNRMQKAMSQMNIQLANVISDISGVTGMKILRAICAGERDPVQLAELTDRRIKAGKEAVARSLHGNWRREHLHALTQELAAYDFLEQQIADCDDAIKAALEQLPLAGEIGTDLSRFPSSQHFCSWLGLAPPTRISGGHRLAGGGPKIVNRAAQALKQAASNARNDKGFIGASHRARLTRMDTSCAIKATAHQLARLVYNLLTKKQAYVEQGLEEFEARSQDRQVRALLRKARKLGYQLVAA